MGRAPCCEKVGLKRGRWTAAEDDILTKYIQTNGEGSWRSLPKNAGLLRCGKSCRLRWVNYLKGDLKRGNISADEEKIIINLHATLGNRWSLIASHLPGRTDNEIKNYWNSHLSRKIDTFRRPANESIESLLDMSKVTIPPKKKGGRTSRWAMKKNRANNVVTQQNVLGTAKKPAAMSKSPGLDLSPGGKDKGEGKKDLVLPNHFQNSEIRMSDSTNGGESDSSVEILGPLDGFCEEMLFDGINDMVDNGDSLELDGPRDSGATWALTIGAQTASDDVPSPSNHNLATGSGSHEDGNVSPNCTGGLCCSSSAASFVEDGSVNWDYLEGFLQGNDNEDSLPLVDEGDEVLSWLWMSDDVEGKNLREVGFDERQEAMVSWLLS